MRCHRCGKKSHWRDDCTEELFSRCHGRGHAADVCPTSKEEAVLAALDDDNDDDTVETATFKAGEAGECSDVLGRKGEEESVWQVGDEALLGDSGVSTHMTPSADCMISYRECNLKLRIADDPTRTIEGYGDVNFGFRSGTGLVRVLLTNVAHVPYVRFHICSLPTLVKNSHTFEGRPGRIVVKLKSERSIAFPLAGNLYSLYGYRVDCSTQERCLCCTHPGKLPSKPVVNMNNYHCAAGHSHKHCSARPRSSNRSSSRKNCWIAQGAPWQRVSAEVLRSLHTRADKKLGRVCGFEWA